MTTWKRCRKFLHARHAPAGDRPRRHRDARQRAAPARPRRPLGRQHRRRHGDAHRGGPFHLDRLCRARPAPPASASPSTAWSSAASFGTPRTGRRWRPIKGGSTYEPRGLTRSRQDGHKQSATPPCNGAGGTAMHQQGSSACAPQPNSAPHRAQSLAAGPPASLNPQARRAIRPLVPAPQMEAEHQQRDAKQDRVNAEPPRQHQRPRQRRHDQQHAPDQRHDPAQRQPKPAVAGVQIEGAGEHQPAGDQRPGRGYEHEGEDRAGREHEHDRAHDQVEHAFREQHAPPLMVPRRPRRRHQGEHAVDQQIGPERTGRASASSRRAARARSPEDDPGDAAQRHRPPVARQRGVLGVAHQPVPPAPVPARDPAAPWPDGSPCSSVGCCFCAP